MRLQTCLAVGAATLLAGSVFGGTNCPADLDNNGQVNGADLGLLLGAWGPCPGCAADLNGDGMVNGADLGLLLGEWGPCPAVGCPGDGSCYESNGSPGCTDTDCCETVCAADPFCCNTTWDSVCANEAFDLCGNCGDPGAGDCYVSNGSPGCNDADCCESVCVADPFCCNVNWDSACANEAIDFCPGCGNPEAGDCLTANGTPYCDDSACCEAVCDIDAFCCNTAWDTACANEAADVCYFGCANGEGNCYASNGSPGCSIFECCVAVCEVDSFCCENTWDGVCAGEAAETCGNCGDPAAGGCFVANGTPGCDDLLCCELTCAEDPFCCNVGWDSFCADEAAGNCGFAACPGEGDCFVSNGSPGCNDGSCCELVCAADSFCCENTWDSVCADEAADLCN